MVLFEQSLERGKIAEGKIGLWLRRKGWAVIPVYEKEDTDKIAAGPQVFVDSLEYVAPDMICYRLATGETRFIEAKCKTRFAWYRKKKSWVTGIDRRHFNEYCAVADIFEWPIWLLFLHESSVPDEKDAEYMSCPPECPTGLFGEELSKLRTDIDNDTDKYGKGGMVYWRHGQLRRLAKLDELNS
jgi:hypothetical protein